MNDKYKIMIVDDEEEVREGIARKIHWDELGFTLVATAENGEDALEKAEFNDLDLVLTDIKMPFMDGLTLGNRLKQQFPNIKLIILTGFDEFEYAKQAISLNVVEYILKPVNEEELNQILMRVKSTLDADIASKRNIDSMRENFEKALPLLRERFLNELLWGAIPRNEMESQIEAYELPFVKGKQKNVTIFDIDIKNSKQSRIEYELIPISVKQIVDAHCDGRCIFETYISSKVIVAITEWENKNPIAEIMALANEICDECKRVLELKVTAGIGRCCDTVSKLYLSYSEAVSATEYKAVVGSGNVIYIRDMEIPEMEPALFDNNREKNLTSAIKFGSPELIRATVEDIVHKIGSKNTGDWIYQSNMIGIFSCIIHIIQRSGIDENKVLDSEIKRFFRMPEDVDTEKLKSKLTDVCIRMNRVMSENRVSTEEKIVADAKDYIAENYHDSNLSVEKLCDYLRISPSYFSTLFKKVTAQTYVNYLTELRLQKALELLEHTEQKTYFVANSVGYEEPNYFSYVFKKRFGISPSQYRNNLQAVGQ